MRYRVLLFALSSFFLSSAVSAYAQAVTQVIAGPNGAQFRVVATVIPQSPEDMWKLQSFILDTPLVKQGQQPAWFMVDLTTTSRNLDTDAKKQRVLLLRWTPTAGIEAQCTQGWEKSTGTDIDKIMESTRSLYQLAPVQTLQPVQLQLPKDVEQKLLTVLNSLETSKLPCIQESSSTPKQ